MTADISGHVLRSLKRSILFSLMQQSVLQLNHKVHFVPEIITGNSSFNFSNTVSYIVGSVQRKLSIIIIIIK